MMNPVEKTRRGAAFLLLVVALLLVVIGATQAMLRAEIGSQRNQRQRAELDTLVHAITVARTIQSDWQQPIRLPIDVLQDQLIVVSANEDKTMLTATWMTGDQPGQSITRPVDPPAVETETD